MASRPVVQHQNRGGCLWHCGNNPLHYYVWLASVNHKASD